MIDIPKKLLHVTILCRRDHLLKFGLCSLDEDYPNQSLLLIEVYQCKTCLDSLDGIISPPTIAPPVIHVVITM